MEEGVLVTNGEFKRKLLETGLFTKRSGVGQYVSKVCPFCGDAKNHMYVLIKQDDDNTPVLYNCFKCNAHGIMNADFLNYFGIDNIEIPRIKGKRRIQPNGVNNAVPDLLDFEKDTEMIGMSRDYIHFRVGVFPSDNELKMFQIVGNPCGYIDAYLGGDMNGIKNRIWFRLSNGNIIGRSIDPDNSFRWKKRNYVGNDRGGGIYLIKNQFDPYQTITICVCEGVMDAIGLYYHSDVTNGVFIACMGRDYSLGLKYAIDMGIFGASVAIRIYKDSDVKDVWIPYKYSMMFKSVSVYHNAIGKDYGVWPDKMEIEKCM